MSQHNAQDIFFEGFKYTLGIVLLGVIIEFVAYWSILPDFKTTLQGLRTLWKEGSLQHNLQVTTARWLIGWSVGGLIGVIVGYLTGRIKILQLSLEGLFVVLRTIPFICLVPISILLFGLEESGKFFLIAWASATVTWVIVHDAAQNVAPHHKWRALSLGASKFNWIFKVLLPVSSKGIYSGLRASLSIGLIVVAVAEMSGVYESSSGYWWSEGLGYRMFKSLDEARNDLLMASILAFAFLGILGDLIFRFVWKLTSLSRFRLRQHSAMRMFKFASESEKDFKFIWQKPVSVELNDINARYGSHIVIKELSMVIKAGNTMSIVGPSGCGKTTLIRAIGHFTDDVFKVSDGVKLDNFHVTYPSSKIGIVMQEAPVFEHMTVWDNILFGNRVKGNGHELAVKTVFFIMREFGIEKLAIQKAGTLSGGQRQRVAMAMALANRPELLLLDEPFGSLDAITRRNLQMFYGRNINGKISAVFVTHDVEEALLVGNSVRVGVEKQATTIQVDTQKLTPHEWELTESFSEQKSRIISALEEL